jgi:hypothetical protein
MVRLQAAQMFAQDASPVQVAHRLRVSTKSACQWWRRWRAGGQGAGVGRARWLPVPMAARSLTLGAARLPRPFFMFAQTPSAGLRSGAVGGQLDDGQPAWIRAGER